MQVYLHFPQIVAIFDDFSEFCCIFGILHFEKSSNTANFFKEKLRKNLPVILLLLMAAFGTKIDLILHIYYFCRYLKDCSVAARDFNSYGSRRGNDAIMSRGTFANIRLVNKLFNLLRF